jgi:hypothetical protein
VAAAPDRGIHEQKIVFIDQVRHHRVEKDGCVS